MNDISNLDVQLSTTTPQRIYPKVTHELVTITPSVAASWLTRNIHNRAQRVQGKQAYGRDMANDAWQLNGDTIKFDWFGNLIDGQHRLEACVAEQKNFQSIVVWGLDPAVLVTIDTGMVRSFRDQLRMDEVKASATVSALARRVYLWMQTGERMNFTRGRVTTTELTETLRDYPEIYGCAEFAEPLGSPTMVNRSTLAFLYWMLMRTNVMYSQDFIEKLATGVELGEFDPIYQLRKRIDKERRVTGIAGHHMEAMILAFSTVAWNNWLDGNPVGKIQLPNGGMKAENMAQLRPIPGKHFDLAVRLRFNKAAMIAELKGEPYEGE